MSATHQPGASPEPAAAALSSGLEDPAVAKSSVPELELSKLQSLPAEQQALFLFTFVSDLKAFVRSLSPAECTAQQRFLKRVVFQIINLAAPQPSRAVRNNLGQCLAHVFRNGDRKVLFETINDLVAVISGVKSKSDADSRARHAAITCLGDVFAAAGDSAIGLHQLSCTTLLKTLKSSSNNAAIRAAVFTSLTKITTIIQGSMDESISRDIWKQSRSYATADKGALVVISACRCIKSLNRHTPYFRNSSDFDKLEASAFKIFDSSSAQVRHAAADCWAEALVQAFAASTLSNLASPKGKRPKALKRVPTHPITPEADDEIPSRPPSPVPGGKRTQDLSITLPEILKLLANLYVKPAASNRVRAAIGVCYGKLFSRLGERTIQNNHLKIVESLTVDLLGHPNVTNNRHRLLLSRRIVDINLQNVIGRKILGESGQISAAKVLIDEVLKNYPQVLPEQPEPTEYTLVTALSAVASLIRCLGSASSPFAESCRDRLLQVLQHPSYSVQVFAAYCMKTFVLACPQHLLSCLSVLVNSLTRELSFLGGSRSSPRKCLGLAHGLAATLSASPFHPLHGSLEINSRVLAMATNLLKSSGQSELHVSSTQIQVAWILIGGLMSLGPNFVKIHLSQLLLLWKNALPKPTAKDNISSRSLLEASFLTQVRECALGSILAFLQYNSRLLTVDVSRRIATMLQCTSAFLRALPSKKTTDDVSQRLTPALQLQDLDTMVQRRVLQCYIKLVNSSPAGGSEALLQSNLPTLAISLFADPEKYTPNSLSSSIANAAATFESIWDVGDNIGFGITGLVQGFKVQKLPGQHGNSAHSSRETSTTEELIDNLLLSPVCGILEHDASILYIEQLDDAFPMHPDPPATEVINNAIQLFAFAFPVTPSKVQESLLEQLRTFASAGSLQRDPGRRAAINVNVALAILCSLIVAVKETNSSPGSIASQAVERLLQDVVRDIVLDPDQYVRSLGCAAVARLCNVYGDAFTNSEIKYLVDTIVINREPSARAGCAMALGTIPTKVGGLAAGNHLKTTLGILMSLCNDPHPTVHYWALESLSMASDAAGLNFASYVPGTLGMLARLYASETHHPEVASAITMNLELELSSTAAIVDCLDSLINVLGPDLQEANKSRELIFSLVDQLQDEEEMAVQRATLGCLEHLSLYAPGQMEFSKYVKMLQKHLSSENTALRDFAVDGLYNIMKRDPQDVLREAEQGFQEELWLVLDADPCHDGIHNLVRNWLHQTCLDETAAWLQRLQAVTKMTRPKAQEEEASSHHAGGSQYLQDEEVAGFAAAPGASQEEKDGSMPTGAEPLRWQVTRFAISCIDDLFNVVAKDVAANGESQAQAALQSKIADVVRMAFSASTSNVLELRVWGLKTISAVLKMFGKTPDPDFDEVMLLEQYQAQISSALTPAFAADSSPELAAEAVDVCAGFIAIGIVTDVERNGRILKTLVNALESFSDGSENAGIGDLKGLSSNAQVMVKIAVFSAWAELQVASTEQKHLLEVLKPRIGILAPLWLESLREFARLRFEPDISMTLGPASLSGSLDSIYAALNRETLLRFYQDAWLKLVDAIASLIEQDSEFVFDALDGRESGGDGRLNGNGGKSPAINYRDEPVAFFFVLFGLAFEALAVRPGQSDSLATQGQTLDILEALKRILHPSISGHAIYRPDVFSETMDLLDRLVLTENLDVQAVIVEIARGLCVAHPGARSQASEPGDLSDEIEQLFELTRMIVLVLCGLLPNLCEAGQPSRHPMNEEAVALIRTSLDALVDAAEVFPSVIRSDLHACMIHIFATILATPICQEVVVPQALVILKRFVGNMPSVDEVPPGEQSLEAQLQGCLGCFMSIYQKAQRREEASSLACVRNCLLAATILFTSGKEKLRAKEALVVRYLDEVLDCLTDRMTAKIAATCIRSLLLQSTSTTTDLGIDRYLVPRLMAFVAGCEEEDPEQARSQVAHTLCLYVGSLPPEARSPAMALVMPVLMARARSEGEAVYGETRARLLELAAVDQVAFRSIVGAMSDEQRRHLEEVIRSKGPATSGPAHDAAGSSELPSITLKMDFGD